MKKTSLNVVAAALALLALGAGATMALRFDVHTRKEPAATALFAQTFSDADGRMQPINQWQGGVLVVSFWATWCAPCIEEMPDLQEVQAEYATRGVTIVGVAIDNACRGQTLSRPTEHWAAPTDCRRRRYRTHPSTGQSIGRATVYSVGRS